MAVTGGGHEGAVAVAVGPARTRGLSSWASERLSPRGSRGKLYISEPIEKIPWETFLSYSLVGGFLCVGSPLLLQLFYEFNCIHRFEDIKRREVKSMHATEASYLPVGLLTACCIAFACAVLHLRCYPHSTHLIMKEAQPQCWAWRLLPRVCRTHWCVRHCFLSVAVVIFSLLPLVAWSDRWIWNTIVLDVMRTCERVCIMGGRLKHDEASFEHNCKRARLNELRESINMADAHRTAFQKMLPTTANQTLRWVDSFKRPVAKSETECKQILRVNETVYIGTMVRQGGIFAAFESRFRTAKQISTLEIHGAALSVFVWIMMYASRLALRKKAVTLHDARKELMLNHFMGSKESCKKYLELFRQLYCMQGHFEDNSQYFITKVLANYIEGDFSTQVPPKSIEGKPEGKSAASVPRWRQEVFDIGDDDDDDGKMDQFEEKACYDEECTDNMLSNIVALVFAVGRAAIPVVRRWLTAYDDNSEPFFTIDVITPALLVNDLVAMLFSFLWFRQFVHSSVGLADKFQLAVAFDCLWQFPGSNPIQTVMRDTIPLLAEIKMSTMLQTPDPEQKSEKLFKENGYRATFGCSHGRELWKEVHKLEEWYRMRRYLQIDKLDEWLGMQLAMVVALFALLPGLITVSYYGLVLKDAAFMQTVNLVLLWDFAFIIVGVFRVLMRTLAFNDVYDNHRKNLSTLRQHIKVEMATSQACGFCRAESQGESEPPPQGTDAAAAAAAAASQGSSVAGAGAAPRGSAVQDEGCGEVPGMGNKIYEGRKAEAFVETFQMALEEFDAPSEFLGFAVSRRVITAYTSAAFVLLAPQILEMFKALCS